MSMSTKCVIAALVSAPLLSSALEARSPARVPAPKLTLGDKLTIVDTSGNAAPVFGPPLNATALIDQTGQKYGYPSLPTVWRYAIGSPKKLFVCWENTGFDREKAAVKAAVTDTWQAKSGLRFTGWETCVPRSAGIRIRIADTGPHTKGLGNQLNGVTEGMVLNFTYLNWSQSCQNSKDFCNRTIAVHEFGHAIGIAHEQNRPDTPGECNQPAQGANGTIMLTPYAKNSVMNYCSAQYGNNGVLDPSDIYTVQALYCKPEMPTCKPQF